MKTILAIGPHPDDIELGCFGTMCRHKAEGDDIHFLVLTKGEGGSDTGNRIAEARESAGIAGANIILENLKDRYISEGLETISAMETVITRINPDVVYIPSMNDTHQDHRSAYRAALVATRMVSEVYIYQSPSTTTDFKPNLYVDITDFIEMKIQAVRIHSSQGGKVYMAAEAIEGLAKANAFQVFLNGRYAEAFEVQKHIRK